LAYCRIPHSYLQYDLSFPTCFIIRARARAHNARGWGEWSPEATGGRGARVHGCPSVYDLTWDSTTDETITVSWEPFVPGREAAGCASEFSYELEYREPGTGQQWFEAYPSETEYAEPSFTRD
jgi:hypothetical protein